DGVRCRHRPTESERIFRASRFSRGAMRARWRNGFPIPRASGTQVQREWKALRARASLEPSLQDGRIGINAAVAEERPVPANLLDAAGIAFHNQDFFLVRGRFGEHLSKRIANEGMAPEFEAALGSAFESDAIHGRNEHAVGNGMGTLDGAPRVELRGAEFLLLGWMPANRGRIKENVGCSEAREAR